MFQGSCATGNITRERQRSKAHGKRETGDEQEETEEHRRGAMRPGRESK